MPNFTDVEETFTRTHTRMDEWTFETGFIRSTLLKSRPKKAARCCCNKWQLPFNTAVAGTVPETISINNTLTAVKGIIHGITAWYSLCNKNKTLFVGICHSILQVLLYIFQSKTQSSSFCVSQKSTVDGQNKTRCGYNWLIKSVDKEHYVAINIKYWKV